MNALQLAIDCSPYTIGVKAHDLRFKCVVRLKVNLSRQIAWVNICRERLKQHARDTQLSKIVLISSIIRFSFNSDSYTMFTMLAVRCVIACANHVWLLWQTTSNIYHNKCVLSLTRVIIYLGAFICTLFLFFWCSCNDREWDGHPKRFDQVGSNAFGDLAQFAIFLAADESLDARRWAGDLDWGEDLSWNWRECFIIIFT